MPGADVGKIFFEFTRLCRYDVSTGAREDVEAADWDISLAKFSRQGTYRLTAFDVAAAKPESPCRRPATHIAKTAPVRT